MDIMIRRRSLSLQEDKEYRNIGHTYGLRLRII